ncbi:unnamed protein product [Allacma fusca]|uniref:CCHC-type domain-containing protein n=1 Tax=Allacma fusca TaxID=39272 RepID=A0A8J2JJ66_9HEXA|nr:unnamed protein product [Allacma fusca]
MKARGKPNNIVKMVCKDEVVNWFHKLNGAGRLDAMCALLDVCLPFEIRFLGTYMENLGRRDFHELRDADHRANSFLHLSRPGVSDRQALCNALVDSPQASHPPNGSVHSSGNSAPSSRPNQNTPEISSPGSRSNSEQSSEKRVTGSISSQSSNAAPEVSFVSNRHADENTETGGKTAINSPTNTSENEYEEGGKCLLVDDLLRRRLVLYMSLLNATNRRCANAYYKVLSEVQPLLEQNSWLDMMEESMVDEMALLYTISGNHPAFTFDQRRVMSEVGNTFRALQTKVEASKLQSQTAPTFYATAVQGFDPKYGHYYIHCIPHPLQTMQWQSPNGGGNLLRTANGTVEDANMQNPVTFTIPPYHPFPPAIFMPAHSLQNPSIHHTQVAHQFSSNIPVQTTLSPQAQMGHHPSQILNPNSYQQNPRVQGPTVQNHNAVHMQSQPRVPHASVNGPVPSILTVPISGIHAQIPPVGLTAAVISSTSVPSAPKTQTISQISPPMPTIVAQSGNNLTPATFPAHNQSNSIDGNESEECCWDSSESSPYQSPPQSLTASRSQSPIPVQYVAPLITSQTPGFGNSAGNQTTVYANVQPNFSNPPPNIANVPSNLPNQTPHSGSVAPHLIASQPEVMLSHSTPTNTSSLPQRPTMGTSAASISPPPRSQQLSGGSQNSQNSRMLSKNAQNLEGSTLGTVNHNNPPYPGVVSTPSVNCSPKPSNCVVSSNSVNGMLTDRRPVGKAPASALIKNMNHTSPGFVASPIPSMPMVSQSAPVLQPVVAVTSTAYPTNAPPHLVASSSRSYGKDSPRRPVSRRPHTSNAATNHTSCSASNHYVHSLPNKTGLGASSNHNLSQYNPLPFPFPANSKGVVTTGLGGVNQVSTKPPPVQAVTSQDGAILFSNDIVSFCGDLSQCNGIKLPTIDSFTVPSGLSVINASVPSGMQIPHATQPPSVQTSRNPILLEVGGNQDLVNDGSQFSSPLDDVTKMRPKMSCYTCGAQSHYGPDCKESTMEEMTKHPYRINFLPENSAPETKDGE